MRRSITSIALGLGASLIGAGLFATAASAQATLANVKQKGYVTCGSNPGLAGFGVPDAQGNWSGLDVDYCRAISAAIFNDPTKIRFIPLSAKDRFTALQSGEVDVLVRNSTETMSRDTALGISFTGVNYYDGQGFMVHKKLNVTSAKQLDGASVCTQQGTTTELNLADYFRSNNMKYEVVSFATADDTFKAYDTGRCDAFTTDASGLYAERLKASNPDDNIVLPEIISKEPLGPSVRKGDAADDDPDPFAARAQTALRPPDDVRRWRHRQCHYCRGALGPVVYPGTAFSQPSLRNFFAASWGRSRPAGSWLGKPRRTAWPQWRKYRSSQGNTMMRSARAWRPAFPLSCIAAAAAIAVRRWDTSERAKRHCSWKHTLMSRWSRRFPERSANTLRATGLSRSVISLPTTRWRWSNSGARPRMILAVAARLRSLR